MIFLFLQSIITRYVKDDYSYPPKAPEYTLEVSAKEVDRGDGIKKMALFFNKTLPGPLIRARVGEELVVNVINKSDQNFSMHMHGLDQRNSNNMDGVPFLNQLPILPGHTFQYRTLIHDQPGTYWYHSHVGNQSATAFGPLIIEDNKWNEVVEFDPQYHYDEERVIVLNDFFNKTLQVLKNSFSTYSIKDRVIRLRVVGGMDFEYMRFKLEGYNLTIIEMDGTLTKPTVVDSLLIHSGERVSVLVTVPASVQSLDYSYSKIKFNDTTIGETPGNKLTKEEKAGFYPELSPYYKEKYPSGNGHYFPIPSNMSIQNVMIEFYLRIKPDGKMKWVVNEREYNEHDDTEMHKGFIDIEKGKYVKLIVQSKSSKNGICEPHPWHVHGHPFYIIGKGAGKWTQNATYDQKFNNPILKDTFVFLPDASTSGIKNTPETHCGWYELLLKADNPGDWSVHCHINHHMPMGMVTSFHYE